MNAAAQGKSPPAPPTLTLRAFQSLGPLAALVAVKVALHVRDSTSTEILGATESA